MQKSHPHIERSTVNTQDFDQLTGKRSNKRSTLTKDLTDVFNDEISYFKTLQSEPETITLFGWLKACKYGSKNPEIITQVLEYRRTNNPELKKTLPLATVGAVCKHGRKLDNVVNRTGWIALDIDAKDNPHLTDAKHIRDEVAKITNIAFSGLSTGGAGVWALVKVANPNKQAEHFEELKKDFQQFGIVLDSSKGKNPNDARFYSYDPGAVIKESFNIYTKLPPEPIQTYFRPPVKLSNDYTRYAETALKDELDILSGTSPGNRNNQLFKSAASLAGLVAGGLLIENDVRQALEQTALSIGLKPTELNATLKSGFDAGLKTPRTPDKVGRSSARLNHTSTTDGAVYQRYGSRFQRVISTNDYPVEWDTITPPQPGEPEYLEMIRAENSERCEIDPILSQIDSIFEAEPYS